MLGRGPRPAGLIILGAEQWTAVLQDAARVGLLTGLGVGMYQIHPALPGYLAAGWHTENPAGYRPQREACEQALCTATAALPTPAASTLTDFQGGHSVRGCG